MEILIASGADVDAKFTLTDPEDKKAKVLTALIWSAYVGKTEAMELLITNGADVNAKVEAKGEDRGVTALLIAALLGNTRIVKKLIASRWVDLNAKEGAGRTALIRAAGRGHTDTVKALLEAAADLNVKDKEGKTALMYAKNKSHTEIVQLLKGAGAKE